MYYIIQTIETRGLCVHNFLGREPLFLRSCEWRGIRVRFIEECCESKKVLKRIGKISSGQTIGNVGYFILTLASLKPNYLWS